MSDLTEFLLARIAEDEATARGMPFESEWNAYPNETGQPIKAGNARIATCAASVMDHIARHDPARVLVECEAKRQIVEAHSATRWTSEGMEYDLCDECRDQRAPCPSTRALAAVYADHPDYRDEWRP